MTGPHTPPCVPACPACRHAANQAAIRARLARATTGLDLAPDELATLAWLPGFELYTAAAVAGLIEKARTAGTPQNGDLQ